jgi:hypothetical protein
MKRKRYATEDKLCILREAIGILPTWESPSQRSVRVSVRSGQAPEWDSTMKRSGVVGDFFTGGDNRGDLLLMEPPHRTLFCRCARAGDANSSSGGK